MKSIENNLPILSVILPIYNAEKYLDRCIRSIMSINIANIEILLINDGSEDNSIGICKKLSEEDSRIKLFNNENLGVSAARNFGIKRASGRYIMFVDSDDYIEGEKVLTLLKRIEEDTDVLLFGYIRENQVSQQVVEEVEVTKIINKSDLKRKMEDNSYLNSFGFVWNKIYRLDVIKRYNIFFEESFSEREDLMFNLEFFDKANNIVESNLCIYHYIQYEDSLSKRKVGKEAIEQLSSKLENDFKRNSLCSSKIKNSIMASVLSDYIIIDILSDKQKYKDMKKDFKEILKYDKYVIDNKFHNLYSRIFQRAFKKRNILLLFFYYKASLVKKKIKRAGS